jgi:hypothetical protein
MLYTAAYGKWAGAVVILLGLAGWTPSQRWRTFLRNHADGIASMELFVVPTISFQLLYGLLILQHGRRQILWLGVTAHPTADWIAQQLTEAYGWTTAPSVVAGSCRP